jgi:hypothetical protein
MSWVEEREEAYLELKVARGVLDEVKNGVVVTGGERVNLRVALQWVDDVLKWWQSESFWSEKLYKDRIDDNKQTKGE